MLARCSRLGDGRRGDDDFRGAGGISMASCRAIFTLPHARADYSIDDTPLARNTTHMLACSSSSPPALSARREPVALPLYGVMERNFAPMAFRRARRFCFDARPLARQRCARPPPRSGACRMTPPFHLIIDLNDHCSGRRHAQPGAGDARLTDGRRATYTMMTSRERHDESRRRNILRAAMTFRPY